MKVFIFLFIIAFYLFNIHGKEHIIKYIKESGYRVEIYHNIITQDQYILTMFRINRGGSKYKGTVFFVHGFLTSGEMFFINTPNKTLPFLLANDDYDVWIANCRGCSHSLRHMHFNSNDPFSPYWNYSLHEIGIYDLPTMIDFTLSKTRCQKLIYIGYSQGTTTFFIMTSTLPEYNNKIELMVALAPVAFMSHVESVFYRILAELLLKLPPATIMSLFRSRFTNEIMKKICMEKNLQEVCTYPIYITSGFDNKELDKTLIPRLYDQIPDSGSMKQFIHYGQLTDSGCFRQYDYGTLLNKKYYGTVEPPSYDLTKVICRVLLYYASNDAISRVKDVQKLHNLLSNSEMHYINSSVFNHKDYVLAKDINSLVHNSVMQEVANVNANC